MGGVNFYGQMNMPDDIVNIQGNQYNFRNDSKENVLKATENIVIHALYGFDVTEAVSFLSNELETRNDISKVDIASAIENNLKEQNLDQPNKKRLSEIPNQLIVGGSGSFLASGIILGIKTYLGLYN